LAIGPADVLRVIRQGENEKVEFKGSSVSKEDVAKAIVCLSNGQGGLLLLGIEDNKSITGWSRFDADKLVNYVFRESGS